MNQLNDIITRSLIGSVIIVLFLLTGCAVSHAEKADLSKAVFYVAWYDVGKAALEGLKGIKKVEKGFYNSKEINTVYYDPTVITIEEMEEVLKKAGTYQGIAK